MSTSRRSLLKAGAGLVLLGGIPCACSEDPIAEDPRLEVEGGFVTVPFELYPELEQVGGSALLVVRALVIIIAQVEPDTFVCLDAACTHQRCPIRYDPEARQFPCPCHGSVFGESGALLAGPAETPVQSFPASLGDGAVTVDLRDAPIEI